ncbi:hypothetical protein ACFYNX_01010 [Streptomyces sp. NPDC007872]|uniref:hypothetical protein n=1 Tax=Streptomyces sp. NPDC007872 TaxID=3364782 RepID=UPI001392615A|nr:hypothetical protein [Streptomyces sp. SID2131]
MTFSSARAALFVSLRAPLYVFNIVSAEGWVDDRPLVLALTLLAAAVDAGIALRLHRSGRDLMKARVPLDLLYACLGALAVPPTWPYSGVLLFLVPTAIELIAVRGLLLGTLYVATVDGVMYLTRVAAGADPYVFELLFYGVWMLVIGAVAFAVTELAGRQHQRRFLTEREAFRNMVALQTRNELLLGRGGAVVEALNRTWYQLEVTLGDTARRAHHEFRREQQCLSDRTREEARYLADILLEAAAAQRVGRPAVAEHLHFTMDREQRLQVLSPAQAEVLMAGLAALDLTGRHRAEVLFSDPVTGEAQLSVGGRTLHVPPAKGRKLALVPAAVVFGSGSLLALVNPIYADLPLAPVLLTVATTAALGLAAERRRRRRREKGLGTGTRALWLATLFPALLVLAMTAVLPVQWRLADGRIIVPAIVGLTSTLYMVGIIWPELPPRLRRWTIAFCLAWTLVAVRMNPYGAPPFRSVIGTLIIPASVVMAVLAFDNRNRDLGLRLHDQWVERLQATAEDIRSRCFEEEIDSLRRQIVHAAGMVGRAEGEYDVAVPARLLAEARSSLQALRPRGVAHTI